MQTFLLITIAILGGTVFFRWWRQYNRRMLRESLFPEKWRKYLQESVPLYARLPDNLKRELEGHIQVFLTEKYFEGAAGLKITDEMRVTVAAQACVLLLGRKTNYYPALSSIIIYPAAYIAEAVTREGFVEFHGQEVRLGEAWHHGAVVLSWSDVFRGAGDVRDGHNVVLHEFAHLLDFEDGASDGVPPLPQRSQYVSWARVMADEFQQLRLSADQGAKTVLSHYGASNPAEFFAVAVEAFYEKPAQLKRRQPELYQVLQNFFLVDPAAWC